jgi:hypothetical protein
MPTEFRLGNVHSGDPDGKDRIDLKKIGSEERDCRRTVLNAATLY